jgi:hypothetical protein
MRFPSALMAIFLALGLTAAGAAAARCAASQPGAGAASTPVHPKILEPSRAPKIARILHQVALSYQLHMSQQARDMDFLQKVALAKRLLGVRQLVELRRQTLALVPLGQEVSWEYLRRRHFANGEPVGVTLQVPVWVPAGAKRIQTYCGFDKKWQTVAETTPRPSGYVWFVRTMHQVNDQAKYQAKTIQVEVNSKFAPFAALLVEYIFREGWYDPAKRVPLMSLRMGEDTYAASAATPPVTVQCLSFPKDDGDSFDPTVDYCHYQNLAEIYHGRHAVASNHRLGLAIDFNDSNYRGVVDGAPNAISRDLRQYNRKAMHKLDARNLPAWVYRVAKWEGCRLPQEWCYTGYCTDWEHIDVGTK